MNFGISNFPQSKPAVKFALAGLLTKNLVVEGTKLLLTKDVRDVFETVLPEIKSFFRTESETVASTNTVFLCRGYVIGASYSFPVLIISARGKTARKLSSRYFPATTALNTLNF